MRRPLAAGLLLVVALACHGQTAVRRGISIKFDPRVGSGTPSYIVSVSENGVGHYIEFAGMNGPAAQPVPITVSAPSLQALWAARVAVVPDHCASPRKNIAKTGQKQLSVYEGEAVTTCTFDYTEDERLHRAVDVFEAIAETMQMGDRLDHAHRYDRLGLDAMMQSLTAEAQAGRAIEMQNIAPTLQALVDDDRVMDRVRRAAARLLEQVVVSK